MPSPPTIDVDALLQPIPGDDPAGGTLPFETRKRLDELREDIDPERDFEPDDPRRKEVERKMPNWSGVVDVSQQALADTSKDLLLAVRLTEGLTMLHGFAGARDGLRLLRRLSEECWDRLRPPVEEPDDLEVRAGIFNWLDDPVRGGRFPNKLRAVTLVKYGTTPVTFLNRRSPAKDEPAEIPQDLVVAAARAADPASVQNLVDDITEAAEEVAKLGDVLGEKLPSDIAPSMGQVRKALDDCKTDAEFIRRERTGAGGGETSEADGEAAASGTGGGGGAAAGGAMTRDGIYREMIRLADRLAQIEPHSPVPDLVRQAVKLERVRFADLVDELTKDANVLSFLKREIGSGEGGGE
jgi:type VI secretion system protein ImpA